ncbi:MAG: aminopeptidase [Paludibacteraceae bacterium]|nr:aminopeptidase [Paludibacteraceae bacterium]
MKKETPTSAEARHIALLKDAAWIDRAFAFADGYKQFLDASKTEREATNYARQALEKHGFRAFRFGDALKAGDKIYFENRHKSLVAAVIGTAPVSEGIRLLAAHIDSPRLDLKPNPLYEDNELALLKTHYYGGIKKYQWTTIPLALHGVLMLADGRKVEVSVGEDEADPVFYIDDLLPHLAQDQMKRSPADLIKGEELNVVVGSLPLASDDDSVKQPVKAKVLQLLQEKTGMVERDFLSSELEIVPAFKAKDVGLDRALIGAYGQDDRVCAYPALQALLAQQQPRHTVAVVLTDKEEIGSVGNSGLQSAYFRYFVAEIAETLGSNERTVLLASKCLSADVNAAFDPTFASVSEKMNASYIHRGVVLTKYTGARGKSGASDANAEFVAEVQHALDQADIPWQTGELGRVDLGGGGTVAGYLANLGMEVLDAGVPVLSMHAPYELTSKLDVYASYLAFDRFLKL